jgi:hypothetical protein
LISSPSTIDNEIDDPKLLSFVGVSGSTPRITDNDHKVASTIEIDTCNSDLVLTITEVIILIKNHLISSYIWAKP